MIYFKSFIKGFLKGLFLCFLLALPAALFEGNAQKEFYHRLIMWVFSFFLVSYLIIKHNLPRYFGLLTIIIGPLIIPFALGSMEHSKVIKEKWV